jgi:hypothetical protein
MAAEQAKSAALFRSFLERIHAPLVHLFAHDLFKDTTLRFKAFIVASESGLPRLQLYVVNDSFLEPVMCIRYEGSTNYPEQPRWWVSFMMQDRDTILTLTGDDDDGAHWWYDYSSNWTYIHFFPTDPLDDRGDFLEGAGHATGGSTAAVIPYDYTHGIADAFFAFCRDFYRSY